MSFPNHELSLDSITSEDVFIDGIGRNADGEVGALISLNHSRIDIVIEGIKAGTYG